MFYFHPYYLAMMPILTSIFFKWVGSTTNSVEFKVPLESEKATLGWPSAPRKGVQSP